MQSVELVSFEKRLSEYGLLLRVEGTIIIQCEQFVRRNSHYEVHISFHFGSISTNIRSMNIIRDAQVILVTVNNNAIEVKYSREP